MFGILDARLREPRLQLLAGSYGFGVTTGEGLAAAGAFVGEPAAAAPADTDVAGVALPAGKTPAPESGAGEEAGEG